MRIDHAHDVVSGADSSPTVVYIDRRIPQYSRRLKTKGGQPANLWKYLSVHETTEAKAMAGGMSYDKAHTNIATPAERKAVEADGVSWKEYTDEIDGYLDRIEREKPVNPPPKGEHVNPEAAIGHYRRRTK